MPSSLFLAGKSEQGCLHLEREAGTGEAIWEVGGPGSDGPNTRPGPEGTAPFLAPVKGLVAAKWYPQEEAPRYSSLPKFAQGQWARASEGPPSARVFGSVVAKSVGLGDSHR